MTNRLMKRLVWIISFLFAASGVSAQQVEYYHLDGIGSVRAISDANGNEIARHDYLPFGEEWNQTNSPDRLRFAGKERDTETGLDYLGARYLGQDDGRFRSVDPVMAIGSNINDPQQWNRYSYARNNPTAYVDPDGRIIESAWDAVSLGAGLLSLKSNLQAGNYWSAALDTVGVVADGAALFLPGVPGGAGAGLKALRGGDAAVDLARGGNRASDLARGGGGAAEVARGGDGFLVGPSGTAVHRSQAEMVTSIENVGARRIGPTRTSEPGGIYRMDTPGGPMDIRVMLGRTGGSRYQGRRTVVTRPGTREFVNPNGTGIRGNVPLSDRKAIGHIHGQTR